MSAGGGRPPLAGGARGALALLVFALLTALAAGGAAAALDLAEADGRPGLGLEDIRRRFGGDPAGSALVRRLAGPDGAHVADPIRRAGLLEWALAPGRPDFDAAAHRAAFEAEWAAVVGRDCRPCHGPDAARPLLRYADLEPYLAPPVGPPFRRLAARTARILGLGSLLLLAAAALGVAAGFRGGRPPAILVGPAAAGLLVEEAGVWAVRLTGAGAVLVPAGALLAAGGLVLLLLAALRGLLLPPPDRNRSR
ncbi:MAG: hypothetical protein D6702_00460 [Planctomycetota bacterium]|nr:MAG: hypothetical protein D6702_00460 [Planctomycetota bacterium]